MERNKGCEVVRRIEMKEGERQLRGGGRERRARGSEEVDGEE
jgi:hypothetical protein